MTTALEIEKALERLPEGEQKKIAEWFAEHRLVVEASTSLASIYDDEDGGGSFSTNEPCCRGIAILSRL